MKTGASKTHAIHEAAFMMDGIGRSSDITEQLLPHARMLARNITAYAAAVPGQVLGKSFVLMGFFERGSLEYRQVSDFLDRRISEDTVQPMAGVAEASMLTGPKRPDNDSHEAGGFVARILPDLTKSDNCAAFESAGTVLMHSDARENQRRVSARFLRNHIHDAAASDIERASLQAALAVVAGGKLTPDTEEMIALPLANYEKLAEKNPDRAYRTARTTLVYCPPGSHEAQFAEDRILQRMIEEAQTGNTGMALTIGWSLVLAGSQDRHPRQIAIEYMTVFKPEFTDQARTEFDTLVTANQEARERIVNMQRKLQRDTLRGSQAARVLAGSLNRPAQKSGPTPGGMN